MRIIFLPEVLDYFNELTKLLYEKGYFGFEENALRYVDDLMTQIRKTLPGKQKKEAPQYFNRYGKNMLYITIRKNKNTHWYVFFTIYQDKKETVYLVRYISNNHMIAQYL